MGTKRTVPIVPYRSGLPLYYDISADLGDRTFVRVHHSRILRFIGRELPYMEMQRGSFWGASELEHIWEELQKRSALELPEKPVQPFQQKPSNSVILCPDAP